MILWPVLIKIKMEKLSLEEFENRFGMELNKLNREEWFINAIEVIKESFQKKKKPLSYYFTECDTNKSNCINYKEFTTMLKKHCKDLTLTKQQKEELFKFIDVNDTKSITIDEFSKTFYLKDTKDSDWGNDIILKLYAKVHSSKDQIFNLFRKFDLDGNGHIEKGEFKSGLKSILEENLSNDQIKLLYHIFDKNNDGTIDYQEFFDAFKVVQKDPVKKDKKEKTK